MTLEKPNWSEMTLEKPFFITEAKGPYLASSGEVWYTQGWGNLILRYDPGNSKLFDILKLKFLNFPNPE